MKYLYHHPKKGTRWYFVCFAEMPVLVEAHCGCYPPQLPFNTSLLCVGSTLLHQQSCRTVHLVQSPTGGWAFAYLSSPLLFKTWLIHQEVAYCRCQMMVMIVKHFKWHEPDGAIPAFWSWTRCVPATHCLCVAT